MKLQKRTTFITEGSSGVGLSWRNGFLRRRNAVIITGRSQEKLERAKLALPAVHILKSDVGDATAILESPGALVKEEGARWHGRCPLDRSVSSVELCVRYLVRSLTLPGLDGPRRSGWDRHLVRRRA
jgi:NAD(P)-dependent dehydrogenase (short-subunit alcohol dehydrogenase family)